VRVKVSKIRGKAQNGLVLCGKCQYTNAGC
jgi:hypothetical protein